MSKEKINYLAGLEVGSTKVAMAVTKVLGDKLEVVATAQAPHKGVHQGAIVDSREIISAIQKVKNEVEATADAPIVEVHLTVADLSVETVHSKGVTSVKRSVSVRDIDAALLAAQESAQVRSDREIFHCFPQFYKIGGTKFEEAPLGQKASALEVHVVLITGAKKNLQTVREAAASLGLTILSEVAHPIATASALLQDADRAVGVAVVDIGGSVTNIVAYKGGKFAYAKALPIGGTNFTQDLAVGLRTPQLSAEKIKKNHGAALVDLVSPGEIVEIESLKGEPPKTVDAQFICEILEARSEETLSLILRTLNNEDLLTQLKSGVIVTGGGSLLPGLPELGEFTFDIPFRRGGIGESLSTSPLAQSPALSTVMGVLHYARTRHSFEDSDISMDTFKGTWGKIKNFFEDLL